VPRRRFGARGGVVRKLKSVLKARARPGFSS
jgi:hypothetical protein